MAAPVPSTCCLQPAERPPRLTAFGHPATRRDQLGKYCGREAATRQAEMDAHRLCFHLATQPLHRDTQAAPLLPHARRDARCGGRSHACRDRPLELEHLAGAHRVALAPHWSGRVNLQAPAALEELGVDGLDMKDATAAVEIGEITRAQPLPAALRHPRREHRVEDHAARGGEHEATLMWWKAVQRRADTLQIAGVPAEALGAEVVRHPALCDRLEPRCEALVELSAATTWCANA